MGIARKAQSQAEISQGIFEFSVSINFFRQDVQPSNFDLPPLMPASLRHPPFLTFPVSPILSICAVAHPNPCIYRRLMQALGRTSPGCLVKKPLYTEAHLVSLESEVASVMVTSSSRVRGRGGPTYSSHVGSRICVYFMTSRSIVLWLSLSSLRLI